MIADFAIFYHAAWALRLGQSPYTVAGFYNPVWALLPILPLTWLPIEMACVVYSGVTLIVIVTALYLLHVRGRRLIGVVLLSPLVWANLMYANVDGFVLLGAALPPVIGIWLLILKPQWTIVLIVGWSMRAYRAAGWCGVGRLLGPVCIVLTMGAIVFGLPRPDLSVMHSWSADVFPYGLPLAGWLIGQMWHNQDEDAALAAGLFLSPYVGITSWVGLASFGAKRSGILAVLIGLGWWGIAIFRNSL